MACLKILCFTLVFLYPFTKVCCKLVRYQKVITQGLLFVTKSMLALVVARPRESKTERVNLSIMAYMSLIVSVSVLD